MFIKQIIFILGIKLVLLQAAAVFVGNSNNTLLCNNETDANCSSNECLEVCGCDRIYIYDEETSECILNIQYLKELTASRNYISSENDMVLEDDVATKLQERVEKVFRGIIGSAIFFIICCSVCVVWVIIFCCHIHRSDRLLKIDVDALAKKMKIDIRKKGPTTSLSKKPRDQIDESCNVIVQDANVMCV